MYIERTIEKRFERLSKSFPVIGILGPRQVGKTTLVKFLMKKIDKECVYLDLERTSDINKLKNAELYLSELKEVCVIIDEIQRMPQLFPLIRSLVDDKREALRFIILGSATPDLIRDSSESLAGRIAYLELFPFNIIELANKVTLNNHILYGGFPNAILEKQQDIASEWVESFIRTYIEKDLRLLGLDCDNDVIRKLWEMLAWQNGNIINYESISKSLGISGVTVKRYVSFLENVFLVKLLKPYHYNIKKRLVKSPKVYISDTGILHRLLRINDFDQLSGTPIIGNSWEGYVIEQIRSTKDRDLDMYYYRTHAGAEIDLVLCKGLEPVASIELKYSSNISLTKGFYNAVEDLGTKNNFVINPINDDYPLDNNTRVCGVIEFISKYLGNL
jgi:predicted AAA+ superfamily ATPase